MTITDFIQKYDKEGNIVLLEGKRNVKEEDKEKLVQLGRTLAGASQYMKFRSGNATGSDELFSRGVAMVDHSRLQVITPYANHRQKKNLAYETISMDDINIADENAVIISAKKNKKTKNLIDKYVEGDRGRFAIKAAYIIRDTVKVLGTSEIPPIVFGLFYDDLQDPMSGGTGHTMNVCIEHDTPILDQNGWFDWLEN